MRHLGPHAPRHQGAGFTLIELLIVMGIIAVAAAVAVPNIAGYVRAYRIRAATNQLAGEIQAARNRAVTKNVNLGVVFMTRSATTYQWTIEDDQQIAGGFTRTRPTIDATFLDNRAQSSPVYSLPVGVQFTTTCASPALPAGGWDNALRFDRLGSWCDPTGTTEPCPDVPEVGAPAAFVYNITTGDANYPSGSVICLSQDGTGLTRKVTVLGGGRVVAQP